MRIPQPPGEGPEGDSRNHPALSVVIPVFSEGPLVNVLYQRLSAVMAVLPGPYEIIVVDDGSQDSTFAHLQELHRRDPAVKIIRLARNFGHQLALSAGLARATGERIAVMDGDLQDPPELLPIMLRKLDEGYDVA